jgi:cytochrome c peroxidase
MFSRCLSSGIERRRHPATPWLGAALAVAVLCIIAALPVAAGTDEPISGVEVPAIEPSKVALGKILFNDPRLSGDGARSCATCHDTETNGASGARFDRSPEGAALEFNTPTVFNAALNFRLNWQGNFSVLQDHARSLITNPNVMGGNMDAIVQVLGADPAIRDLAEAAYDAPLDENTLADALAAYQQSLVLVDSPFDRWLAGDASALTEAEKQGYRRFKDIGCAACHQGRNVGGNLYQRHGIFHPLTSGGPARVRVPSLRTVYYTPPYFHDGSAETLDKAIRAMGRAQLDVILDEDDVRNIAAFLKSLTGTYAGQSLRKAAP